MAAKKVSATREKTYQKQYAEYLERYNSLKQKGKILKVEINGKLVDMRPYSYDTFKSEARFFMSENPDVDKYTIGKKMAEQQKQYTARQYRHFYKEVQENLDSLEDTQVADMIRNIMHGKTNAKGKWLVSAFEANAREIMDLYFSVTGGLRSQS